jgi:S1-C subfamily serine protease
MSSNKTSILAGVVLSAALAWGPALAAQEACPGGRTIGDLGITGLYGAARDWSGNWEQFRTEPKVRGVVGGGPADGALQAEDVIVAVDGFLITTEEGGRRLARVSPGQSMALTIRRDGDEHTVKVTAGSKCDPRPAGPLHPVAAPRASAATPRPAASPRSQAQGAQAGAQATEARPQALPHPAADPRKPAVPAPPSPQGPAVRFGFRLQCESCNLVGAKGKEGGYWSFPQAPVVDKVEPGSPADLGGLRKGDRLTHIDGLALTSREGGRRLAEIDAGESVVWTFLRGNQQRTAKVVTGGDSWPPRQGAQGTAGAWPAQPTQLRFSGNVGAAQVEVRGAPVNVTEDKKNGEIVIRSQDVLVRVKVPAPSATKQ